MVTTILTLFYFLVHYAKKKKTKNQLRFLVTQIVVASNSQKKIVRLNVDLLYFVLTIEMV